MSLSGNCRLNIRFGISLGLLITLFIPVMQVEAANDLTERFFKEAPRKWEEYLKLASHSTGTTEVEQLGNVDGKIYKYHAKSSFAINGDMARISRVELSRKDRKDQWNVINPRYQFRVSQNDKGDDKEIAWKLVGFHRGSWQPPDNLIGERKVSPKTGGPSVSLRSGAFGHSMAGACQGLLLGGAWFPRLVSTPEFKVKKVVLYGENSHWVTVEYKFEPAREPDCVTRSGTVVLDMDHYWLIQKAEFRMVSSNEYQTGSIRFVNEYDTSGTFPYVNKQIKHISSVSKKGEKAENDSIWQASISAPVSVDESEFTLSAFGLPEPKPEPKLQVDGSVKGGA